MLVVGFPAGAWATNCYVVAPAAGEQCVIIDPGQDAAPGVDEVVREHGLLPVAVLLTHGHIDHVWSVVPVCDRHRVPAYVQPRDRHLLADPAAGFGLPVGRELLGGLTFSEPDDVRALSDGDVLPLAGLELTVDHAPGHTEGSVTFRVPGEQAGLLFSGDLLFAGSIGRTDLPGGDGAQIMRSLSRVCLPLPDDTVVLPGHGPETTIGRERTSNPFLRGLQPAGSPPARGL